MMTEREVRMLGLLSRMHSAWTATSIDRKVTFGAQVVHKAVSAESILKYCLKQRGWTREYKAGELSETDHVELLKDVQAYCQAWLKHEARSFADHYLARVGTSGVSVSFTSDGLARYTSDVIFDRMGDDVHCQVQWRGPQSEALHAESRDLRSHMGRFFGRVRQFIREGIVAGALSLLGPSALTTEELDGVDREVATQVDYLDRFERDMAAGEMSPDEFVARTTSYGTSVYGAGQRVARNGARHQAQQEKRILGDPKTEHCEQCPELAAMGWQPIGSLPEIGQTQCRNNCLCHFVYRFSEGGPEFTRVRPGVYNPL